MPEKLLKKLITALLFVVVIGTPFFYWRTGVYPYSLAKIIFFQTAVEIMFFLWLALAISVPRYRPKMTPLVISGSVFFAAMLIASVAGVDFWRSIWSTYESTIGFFALLHFAALGVVASSLSKELPWKKIFYWSIGASVAIDLIAYIQLYVPTLLLIEDPGSRPGATFGNPTFMSAYLTFHVFIAIYFLLGLLRKNDSPAPRAKIFFVAVAGILDAIMVFFAQTRGNILGLAIGLTALLVIFAIKPPENVRGFLGNKKTYTLILSAIAVLAIVFLLTINNPIWKEVPGLSRFQSVSLTEDVSLLPRLSALNAGWKGFLDKPLLGWGLENFTPVYDRYYNPRVLELSYTETHFDNPHNMFLEYAVSGGIILFAALLLFLCAAVYEGIKQKDAIWRAIFLSSLAAYFAGLFFFFETIGALMMFYLFLGATDGAFRENQDGLISKNTAAGSEEKRISGAVLGLAVILAIIPVYAVNFQTLTASYYQYEGFQNLWNQDIQPALNSFKTALGIWSPYNWNFKRDYAIAITGQYFNYPGTVSDIDALRAVLSMEGVKNEHPEDAFNHYVLINLYNEVANVSPKDFARKAEEEAAKALEISPGRQEVYFYLAKTKTIENDYSGALAILKKTLDEDPKVPDSHFYYGLIAYATGDKTTGYNEIKTAVAMGRPWKTLYEARATAGFFADSGHLNEAIDLYKVAWDLSAHSDIESELKLGIAYYYAGKRDEAKTYILGAINSFDIAGSSSYAQIEPILKDLGIAPTGK